MQATVDGHLRSTLNPHHKANSIVDIPVLVLFLHTSMGKGKSRPSYTLGYHSTTEPHPSSSLGDSRQ
ncbi:hypothetical protein I79_023221 [Cricetulus griseus]|uniref:Uncharacterized protein n=1 Tax=Cricetulus griseus TaxID=10029 RepID=G3IHD2_CRIGR|nr:hypothetical protein I79_023221 [Cricetulus griseus]